MADLRFLQFNGLRQLVQPWDESQEPSQLHDPSPWLVCEVALRGGLHYGGEVHRS